MDKRNLNNPIRRSLDARLSGITERPGSAARVLRLAKGEEKVKKKISLGLVMALVFALIAIGAVAAVILNNYYRDYASLEGKYGNDYTSWPTSAKVELISNMRENGLEIDIELAQDLLEGNHTEAEQDALATRIIVEYYGSTEYMSTYNVMEHELGAFGGTGWSPEDMALYSEIEKEYGIGSSDSSEYVAPNPDTDISQETAIELACKALMDTYGINQGTLDMYPLESCHFLTSNEAEEPVWFAWFVGSSMDEYSNNAYSVTLSRNGAILRTASPTLVCPLNVEFDELENKRGRFVTWSLEEKADFAQTWPAKIEQWIATQGQEQRLAVWRYIEYLATKQFILPSNDDITEKEALAHAEQALIDTYGFDAGILNDFTVYKSFLLDGNGAVLAKDQNEIWRIIFAPKNQVHNDYGYRVDIEAKTGAIVSVIHQLASIENIWASDYE